MVILMNKTPLVISLLAISMAISFFANAADEEIKAADIKDKKTKVEVKKGNEFIKEKQSSSSNTPASHDFFLGEETVTISIVNFGRKNPFKPYSPATGIKTKEEEKVAVNLEDIPYPPYYEGSTSSEIQELMDSKVNGILYDPYARSVAIVNIKGSEHMLHKGDIVQGIMVDNISENYITLRYGSNTYTVGIGEVVEGDIKTDPVQRKQKTFAGSDYDLPDINLEEFDK